MARRKPSSDQPFFDHDVKSQAEQARWLGDKPETVMNLGHPVSVADIAKHPLRSQELKSYTSDRPNHGADRGGQGVYGKFRDPQSGISSADNLKDWSGYAKSNSYTGHGSGKAGPGKDPTMPDPRGRHSNQSDGYLLQPKGGFEYGADSGPGRLEKRK